MAKPYFEVNVPIRNTARPGLHGLHVFTGQADNSHRALRLAREAYDAALAAQAAGLELPGQRPDGWGARGVRSGWEPDWSAAEVGRWNDPYNGSHVRDSKL
ncbi:hypothetical protein HUT19_33500 [Streptomyces sp. NA02950]|uniref:hypothetical protein n=1 Tax=Streptomyces sp. NA02950 TaxID=2742137 RepID=UPI0015913CD0|nr:hypothetical protein [Streptomyces sp. NA02950]QKV96040.1 hypothetical protein HUT19_33500 [Streptomyces sp. NA02950]